MTVLLNNTQQSNDQTTHKKGPTKPYAIDNIMKIIDPNKILEIKKKYYLDKIPKYKLCKDIGISHQLMNDFLARIGPLTPEELIKINSVTIDR
jgi:hypothetical protein